MFQVGQRWQRIGIGKGLIMIMEIIDIGIISTNKSFEGNTYYDLCEGLELYPYKSKVATGCNGFPVDGNQNKWWKLLPNQNKIECLNY